MMNDTFTKMLPKAKRQGMIPLLNIPMMSEAQEREAVEKAKDKHPEYYKNEVST